jgi:non-specific protein-tyrosine kinase
MDLRELFMVVKRWLWLILLGAIIGGVATYFFSVYQPPMYEAVAEVFISQPKRDELSDLGYLSGQQLIQTYTELMVTDQVLGETAQRVNYSIGSENISINQVRDTQILQVKVEDVDPIKAAEFANTLVTIFSEQQYQAQTAIYAESKENLEASMAEQRQVIDETIARLATLPDTEENAIEREWTNLVLMQANETYINLLNNFESLRMAEAQSVSTVQLVEPAKPDFEPVRPKIMVNTILGIAAGLMLVGGIVFLVEYLDDSVRSPEEISQLYDLPVLGYIAKIPKSRNNGDEGVYILSNPRSPVAEAFRSLRTNIEFAGVVEPVKTILVTSPGPEEGKSTVTTNLASVMMQGGKRVVVVDCDMRRPRVHKLFGMRNRMGLSGFFRGQTNLNDVIEKRLNNLYVITSGAVPPNPAELLGSKLMDKMIANLTNMVDVVIIDSPPMVVTDPVILSSKVDGVILVVNPGRTKKDAVKAAMTQFERAEARMLGVIINRIGRNASYYYDYYYPRNYYTSNQDAE